MDSNQIKILLDIIGGDFDTIYEKAPVIYQFLKELKEEDQLAAFELVITREDDDDITSGRKYNIAPIPRDQIDEFKTGLAKLVDGQLQFLVAKRPTPKDLAEKLWCFIKTLSSDAEKTFAIAWILADQLIPYMEIPAGGVRMSNEVYNAHIKNLKSVSKLISMIVRFPNLQATETASLVLGAILSQTNKEDQAVLFATHMKDLQKSVLKKALKNLSD